MNEITATNLKMKTNMSNIRQIILYEKKKDLIKWLT